MNSQYLYGVSVQGIQGFIFETNKLREIAGASEIVEQICTQLFQDVVGPAFDDARLLIGAAGNIKYLFPSRETCQLAVRQFPRIVMETAPGITVSQAVVEIRGELRQEHITSLEKRLLEQRNKPLVQHGLGKMVSERSRKTGKSAVITVHEEWLDAAQLVKSNSIDAASANLLQKLIPEKEEKKAERLFPVEMEDIASNENGWIAVVHADGNDLGKKIMKMAKEEVGQTAFRDLSLKLEKATVSAAQTAFQETMNQLDAENVYPFRPIILGGDDLTVIIRGDLAIPFTQSFLAHFEAKTKEEFGDFVSPLFHAGLTACAGIAYVKPKYPFHYAVTLAESLCARAKTIAKSLDTDRTPGCLLFHRVHASFIEDYQEIIQKELMAGNIRLDFGPYFLDQQEGFHTVSQFQEMVRVANHRTSPKSRLRDWVTTLQTNREAADQQLTRICNISSDRFVKELGLHIPYSTRKDHNSTIKHTHLYDVLTIASIQPPKK